MAQAHPDGQGSGEAMAPLSADVRELLRYGLERYHAGDFAQASRVFETLTGAAPKRAMSWNHLALALSGLGRDDQAAMALRRSLDIDPRQIESWNSLAAACLRLGREAEADAACDRALSLDEANAAAWQMRAMARTAANDFAGAAEAFARTLEIEGESASLCANLGVSLMKGGRFEAAAPALDRAVALDPASAPLADAKALCDLALAAIAGAPLEAPEPDLDRMFKTALLLLDAAGRAEAAGRIAEAWASRRPDNIEAQHLRDSVMALPVARQPAALVAQRFDAMAETFDEHLVSELGYDGPSQLRDLLAGRTAMDGKLDILDLGCGTGLCGPLLRPMARRLHGVDLSPGMLAKARALGLYDGLEVADLLDVLGRDAAAWDMIVILDTFPYLGALEAVFEAAARALRPGGWLTFSTEAAETGDYVLQGNGRYSHGDGYITRLAAGRFEIVAQATAMLRREGGRALDGGYFLLRAPAG